MGAVLDTTEAKNAAVYLYSDLPPQRLSAMINAADMMMKQRGIYPTGPELRDWQTLKAANTPDTRERALTRVIFDPDLTEKLLDLNSPKIIPVDITRPLNQYLAEISGGKGMYRTETKVMGSPKEKLLIEHREGVSPHGKWIEHREGVNKQGMGTETYIQPKPRMIVHKPVHPKMPKAPKAPKAPKKKPVIPKPAPHPKAPKMKAPKMKAPKRKVMRKRIKKKTGAPTSAPSSSPTEPPTSSPTEPPTSSPTTSPTVAPTGAPTPTPRRKGVKKVRKIVHVQPPPKKVIVKVPGKKPPAHPPKLIKKGPKKKVVASPAVKKAIEQKKLMQQQALHGVGPVHPMPVMKKPMMMQHGPGGGGGAAPIAPMAPIGPITIAKPPPRKLKKAASMPHLPAMPKPVMVNPYNKVIPPPVMPGKSGIAKPVIMVNKATYDNYGDYYYDDDEYFGDEYYDENGFDGYYEDDEYYDGNRYSMSYNDASAKFGAYDDEYYYDELEDGYYEDEHFGDYYEDDEYYYDDDGEYYDDEESYNGNAAAQFGAYGDEYGYDDNDYYYDNNDYSIKSAFDDDYSDYYYEDYDDNYGASAKLAGYDDNYYYGPRRAGYDGNWYHRRKLMQFMDDGEGVNNPNGMSFDSALILKVMAGLLALIYIIVAIYRYKKKKSSKMKREYHKLNMQIMTDGDGIFV